MNYPALTKAQVAHEQVNDGELVFPTFTKQLSDSGGADRATATGKISIAIQLLAMIDPLLSRYFSTAPFLFGTDRVMKFSVARS